MNSVTRTLCSAAFGVHDLDYKIIRGSMVLLYLLFGYDKWFEYAAQTLIPIIKSGPLIFWLYPVFGIRGATWFLGCTEWVICALLFAGFWDKRLGALGAAGSTATFIATVTIIPFVPGGWIKSATGLPVMTINTLFLLKDVVLLAVSLQLLTRDFAESGLLARLQGICLEFLSSS